MNELLTTSWMSLVAPVLTALLCFGSALALSGVILMNKGAKVNKAWVLVALGLIAFGLSEGSAIMHAFGDDRLMGWEDALRAFGAAAIFVGAMYARRLFKGLLK